MQKILSTVRSHKIASLLLFFIAFFLIAFYWFIFSPDSRQIYTVKREDLTSRILTNGTFNTASQTLVNSPTNGIISKMYVKDNQEIKKGDRLFYIESTATESEKRTALASYMSAKAKLDGDNALLYNLQSTMYSEWKKFTDLSTNSTYENSDKSPNTSNRTLPEFTTAQDNWLGAEAIYKNQQEVIAADKSALSSAQELLNQTQSVTVTAPSSGIVVNLTARVNDQVDAPNPTLPEPSPVLIITDFSNPVVTSSIDQINIPFLKVGQKASVVFDALPDKTFTAKVSHVDNAGTKVQGSTNFNIDLTVDNLSPEIKPNMTASITVETGKKEKVLTVPLDALIKKDGKNFVELTSNELREVSLGLKGLTKVEVTKGLSEGDKIVEQ